MYKFCFVILHYQAINETKECVKSILENVEYPNYSIVIVDNKSPNKTGQELKNFYLNNEKVTVLLNSENNGFAKGNNLGYKYAKDHFSAEFVACINNDTIIEDRHFIQKIINLYEVEKYHIMGPDIITSDGKHQNPMRMKAITLDDVNYYLTNYNKIKNTAILKARLKRIPLLPKLVRLVKKPKKVQTDYKNQHDDVVLHGAAIIFSPLYVEKETYAFYPETFMFAEEYILYYLCKINGYKILYSPVTSIIHKEDASTDYITKTNVGKLKFIYKHERDSYLILKEILEKNKDVLTNH